ncbi:MAG: hypothetical protein ABIR47_16250 [Candidatus Kapaibacterium sp.]
MTWKDVLDVKPGTRFVHITMFAKAASLLGYRFIAWAGRVYFLIDDYDLIDTGISVTELNQEAV